jgi:hypothetical protein
MRGPASAFLRLLAREKIRQFGQGAAQILPRRGWAGCIPSMDALWEQDRVALAHWQC